MPPADMPLLRFAAAPDLDVWARNRFIDEGSLLENPDHEHLRQASIGWLWATWRAARHGREIAGMCRLLQPAGDDWGRGLSEYLLTELLGDGLPDFLIILSAPIAEEMDDASFCALVEHELYHAGQALDEYGAPRFRKDGSPMFAIRGHDVEQFTKVVERYGVFATGVADMVSAARRGPSIAQADLDMACGSCRLARVA